MTGSEKEVKDSIVDVAGDSLEPLIDMAVNNSVVDVLPVIKIFIGFIKAEDAEKAKPLSWFVALLMKDTLSYDDFEFCINTVNGIPFYLLEKFSAKYDKGDAYIQNQTLFGFLNAYGCITELVLIHSKPLYEKQVSKNYLFS